MVNIEHPTSNIQRRLHRSQKSDFRIQKAMSIRMIQFHPPGYQAGMPGGSEIDNRLLFTANTLKHGVCYLLPSDFCLLTPDIYSMFSVQCSMLDVSILLRTDTEITALLNRMIHNCYRKFLTLLTANIACFRRLPRNTTFEVKSTVKIIRFNGWFFRAIHAEQAGPANFNAFRRHHHAKYLF